MRFNPRDWENNWLFILQPVLSETSCRKLTYFSLRGVWNVFNTVSPLHVSVCLSLAVEDELQQTLARLLSVNTVSVMNPFFQRPNFSDTRSWNRSGCGDSPLLRFVCESDGSQLESQRLIGATLGAPLRGNKAMWTYLLSHLRLRPWSIY